MIQTQKFQVLHNGIINSGDLAYSLNTETGDIHYAGEVFVTMFKVRKALDKVDKVDTKMLQSAHFSKVGQQLKLGDFTLTVTAVHDGKASCDLAYPHAAGKGIIDVSGQFVKILSLDAQGSFMGYNLHLVVQAA